MTINPVDFGFVGDGGSRPISGKFSTLADARAVYPFVDDLTPELDWCGLQAAIDYAYTNGKHQRAIELPDGCTGLLSLPVYLDPPGSLRGGSSLRYNQATLYAQGSFAVYNGVPWVALRDTQGENPSLTSAAWQSASNSLPPSVSWGYSLVGAPGLPSPYAPGCVLKTTGWANAPALIVGPGNGNLVQGIIVANENAAAGVDASGVGIAANYRAGLPSNGAGILISGGPFGASRTLIENTGIYGFFDGCLTGGNQGAVGDSNTWRKCHIQACCNGIRIGSLENFINKVDDCTICYNKNSVVSYLGTGIIVEGGNLSNVMGAAAAYGWSNVSPLVNHGGGTITWTAVVAAPSDLFVNGIFDVMAVPTANFGVVPFTMLSFDRTTNTGTFALSPAWVTQNYPYVWIDVTASSTLSDDIAVAAKFYAAEQVRVFWGTGFKAFGMHIEQTGNAVEQLVKCGAGWGGSHPSHISSINHNNNDPAITGAGPRYNTTDDHSLAMYYNAQVHPYIGIENGNLTLEDCTFYGGDPVLLEFSKDGATGYRFVSNRNDGLNLNCRTYGWGLQDNTSYGSISTAPLGSGEHDTNPWAAHLNTNADRQGIGWAGRNSWGQHAWWGFRPKATETPIITPAQLATLTGSSLPKITNYGGAQPQYNIGYPLLWGGQQYRVYDTPLRAQASYGIMSLHDYYTYGQDLGPDTVPNLSLRYKGGSNTVYCNQELFGLIFPGLGVGISDGTTVHWSIITAVHAGLGYFQVYGPLAGDKNTIYTSAVLKQQPFNFVTR